MKSNLKVIRIRHRASYKLFEQLYEFLAAKPSVKDILKKFYEVLDAKKGFANRQNAEYAAESLALVLKDKG